MANWILDFFSEQLGQTIVKRYKVVQPSAEKIFYYLLDDGRVVRADKSQEWQTFEDFRGWARGAFNYCLDIERI